MFHDKTSKASLLFYKEFEIYIPTSESLYFLVISEEIFVGIFFYF